MYEISDSFPQDSVSWSLKYPTTIKHHLNEAIDYESQKLIQGIDYGIISITPIASQGEYEVNRGSAQWPSYHSYSPGSDIQIYPNDELPYTQMRTGYQGYSTLGAAEELALREIAMPSSTKSPRSLSNTLINEQTIAAAIPSKYENKATYRVSKRQKKSDSRSSNFYSDEEEEDQDMRESKEDEEEKRRTTEINEALKKKKQGHNAIEKRYRTSLNDRINSLDKCLPPFTSDAQSTACNDRGEPDRQRKTTKSAILIRAVKHIQNLERNTRRLISETDALNVRIAAFEKLAVSGSFRHMV